MVIPSAKSGPRGQLLRQRARLGEHRFRRDDAIGQTNPVRLGGDDRLAEHQDLGGARQADDLRQQPRRAHVGAGEPDLHEQKGDLRALRHDAKIARQRDHRAGAGGDAVDGRDHRLAQLADGADERAGHAREAPAAPPASIANSGPMISCTLPPEQKPRPAPVMTTALTSLSRSSARKCSRSSA